MVFDGGAGQERIYAGVHSKLTGVVLTEPAGPCPIGCSASSGVHTVQMNGTGWQYGQHTGRLKCSGSDTDFYSYRRWAVI